MFSFISVPPRSLQPACSICRTPSRPILTQLAWILLIERAVGQPSNGVDEQCFPERRTPASHLLQVQRRRHVNVGQADELGEAPGLLLQIASETADACTQLAGCSTAPNIIVTLLCKPTLCAVRCASSHSSVVILSGTQDLPHRVVEDLRGRARQRLLSRLHQPCQIAVEGFVQAPGPLGDLQRREAVDVDVRGDLSHRLGHVDVVVAIEVRVDTALEADLGRALTRRLRPRAPASARG